MKSLSELDTKPDTKVFVRCDLDVPTPIHITNQEANYRLSCVLATLKFLLQKKAYLVIAGHIGKPNGRVVEKFSTTQLDPFLKQHLGGKNWELLENLRFDPREEQNDDDFAKELATKADVYINESFATCHRKHASIVGIPKYLPSYAGFQLEKEVQNLSKLLITPQKPFVVIVGGAKLESKKPLVTRFLNTADYVLVGGKIGQEWLAPDATPNNLRLPIDYVDNKDIGPETIALYKNLLQNARTVVWAGPLGVFENPKTQRGTTEIAQALAELAKTESFVVVGGGDTTEAIAQLGLLDKYSFVSTGGSAMLQFLADGTLPGLEALQ